METGKKKNSTRNIIIIGGMIIAAVIFWRDLRSALLPFILAWVVCAPIRRLARKISSKTRLPFKACAVLCLIFILTTLFFLLKIGISLLLGEILSIYERMEQNPKLILDFFEDLSHKFSHSGGIFSVFDKLSENDELSDIAESLKLSLSEVISNTISSIGQKISGAALNAASKIPSAILLFIVFFSSCFYFTCDDGKILEFFINLLPTDTKNSLPRIKNAIKEIVFGYISSSLLLCIITFFIVLIGLLCVGCRYAVLLSLLVALIDLLPILGAGVILLPWSVFCFLWSDIKTGVALIVIWIIVAVTRQISEPKLIGKRIGLHPLSALASVYIGSKLAGFMGIVAGPLIAVGIKAILPILTGKKQ